MKLFMMASLLAGLAFMAIAANAPSPTTSAPTASSESFATPTGVAINAQYAPDATIHANRTNVRRASWGETAPANDEIWCKTQGKGAVMYATFWKTDHAAGAMYDPPRLSAGSSYHRDNIFNQMFNYWGWTDAGVGPSNYGIWYGDHWMNAMQQLAIGTGPEDCWTFHYIHGDRNARDEHGVPIPISEQEYYAYNMPYPATGARAKFGVQDKAGAIFITHCFSPTDTYPRLYGHAIAEHDLPQVRSLSDLLFAGWLTGSHPRNGQNPNLYGLKYIFMIDIVNRETVSVMKRALASRGKDRPSVWPGDDFNVADAEGQALLGTPNGKPIGYLLNQHKNDLGYHVCYNIRLFLGKGGGLPIMMFWISPLRDNQIQRD